MLTTNLTQNCTMLHFPPQPRSVPVCARAITDTVKRFLEAREQEPGRDEGELLEGFLRQLLETELDALYTSFPPVLNRLDEAERLEAFRNDPQNYRAAMELANATLNAGGQPAVALQHHPQAEAEFLRRVMVFIRMGQREEHLAALNYAVQRASWRIYGDPDRMPTAERRRRQMGTAHAQSDYSEYLSGSLYEDWQMEGVQS